MRLGESLTPLKEPRKGKGKPPNALVAMAAAALRAPASWAVEWPILRELDADAAFARFKALRAGREPGPPADLVRMPAGEAVAWLEQHYPLG